MTVIDLNKMPTYSAGPRCCALLPLEFRCSRCGSWEATAEMLDPDSRHPLRLEFKQRKSGRPRLARRLDWLPFVLDQLDNDAATLSARRAEHLRSAMDSGRKVPHKQLRDGISSATYYRRRKLLSESGITRPSQKAQSKSKKIRF